MGEKNIRRILFYLAPQFSMMSLLPLTEVLRKANEVAETVLYDYSFVSAGESAEAVNGMAVATSAELPRDRSLAAVVLCSSYQYDDAAAEPLGQWVRWLDRHGVPLGVTDTAAFLIKRARVSWPPPICTHWLTRHAFAAEFPDSPISSRFFEYTPTRFSCGGATAGLDLMLHVVAEHHGQDFSTRVGSHLFYGGARERRDSHQSLLAEFAPRVENPVVLAVLKAMDETNGAKRPISDLAAEVKLSQSQLERLFKRFMHATPARIYQIVRLRKAHSLIRSTRLPIEIIADQCGFASRSQFSAAYKAQFGVAPGALRRNCDVTHTSNSPAPLVFS